LSTPYGYTASAAIAMVRLRSNEYTAQTDAQVLTLLNAGIEQVEAEIGGIRLYLPYDVTSGQQVITFNEDIQDIFSMSFSTGPLTPAPSTAIVYPMRMLEPEQFMQQCSGFPGVGAGPPTYFMIYQDENSVMTAQLYPPCMLGQLNVYYRGRPQLWADATVNSTTNLDTMAQEAVILWAICRVLESVQRGDESKDIFGPQYDDRVQKLKESMARRSVPKRGQVSDVCSYGGYSSVPWWYG
jgi:hypothetical protein